MISQVFIKWFLSIFIISLITALIIAGISPRILNEITRFVSIYSADVVANQLSSLISVSSSAPFYIRISYSVKGEVLYDLKNINRRIYLKPNYNTPLMENVEIERFHIVNLPDFEFKNVNVFEIVKKRENDKSSYYFLAYSGD
ncbi:MAG: hypothetical protein QXU71_01535 [Candidatus Aenigmatarchaeota archaeon]